MEDIETTGSDICCTARALLKRSQAGKCRVAEVVIEKRAECFSSQEDQASLPMPADLAQEGSRLWGNGAKALIWRPICLRRVVDFGTWVTVLECGYTSQPLLLSAHAWDR